MSQLKPKPGDIFIVLNDGDGSVSYLLPKATVTDLDRQRMTDLMAEFRRLFIEGRTAVTTTQTVIGKIT
jgi:hypothetical protein